jgi:NADH:ubiquinone oxidoreductase subunit C
MSLEEDIKQKLVGRFGCLENRINSPRPRRLFLDIDPVRFEEVFDYAVRELKFSHLISITGLDEPEKLGFIYHLAHDTGIVLNIKTCVDRNNPVIHTVTGHFPGAEIYELEMVDLFGAKVEGLKPGNRYPLTDDWPKDQFPLRKDWKPNG